MANRHRTSRARTLPAFTLVELVTMLAIIAVLAAIASPRYANSLALYRAQAAAQRIAADLNLARVQAKTSSAGQTIVFDVAANRYTLPGVAGLSGESAAYAVTLSADPYSARLQSAVFTSSATLSFDRYGQPSSGGTVVVRSGTFVKTVLVDGVTGQAAVQ